MSAADALKGGSALITRALDLEGKSRYTEALVCYQEGLKIFMDYMKVAPASDKKVIREKIDHFMSRAELVKNRVDDQMKLSTYHEEVVITENEAGHSYESVFGRFLKPEVKVIKIEDPYIRAVHQFNNFLRFCELVVKNCPELKRIKFVTVVTNDSNQANFFYTITNSLREHNVQLEIESSSTLHDRQISLSNGWVIKMGRGLDYFRPPQSNFSLGYFDMDLRKCHETKIDIYFTKNLVIT